MTLLAALIVVLSLGVLYGACVPLEWSTRRFLAGLAVVALVGGLVAGVIVGGAS